ncbi:MAG: tetratricopeptide repeat protein [Terriglobales bacterium]
MGSRLMYATLACVLAAPPMFSQTSSGGGTTSVPPRVVIPTVPPSTTAPPAGPIFLSGRVVMENGGPPPEKLLIERVCNGRATPETHTDSSGSFSFQLGGMPNAFQDASTGSTRDMPGTRRAELTRSDLSGQSARFTARDLLNCEVRANLAGFHSDSLQLVGHQSLDNPDIGVIVLHPIGKVEGTTVSVTTMLAPKDARKAWEHGRKDLQEHKIEKAQQEFEKALTAYPNFAEAMLGLGDVYFIQKRYPDAEKLYQRAIVADPKFIIPYFQLAKIAAQEHDWARMADLTDHAIALNAYEYPVAFYFNAVAHYELGHSPQAEKSARSGIRLDSQHRIPDLQFVLSRLLLDRKDYAEASEVLKTFLTLVPTGPAAERARAELAQTEAILASASKAPSAEQPK